MAVTQTEDGRLEVDAYHAIFRHVAQASDEQQRTLTQGRVPSFSEPVSWMDALRASWSGASPFGRVVTEGIFDASLFNAAEGPMGEDLDDGTWDIRNEDFTGFEQFAHELAGMPTKRDFEMRKFALVERQRRIEVMNNHGGVLPQMIAHILDPTVLIGYGVYKAAARGVPALVVGARVGAVEAGVVGLEYGAAAIKYEDITAADSVRSAAYAGMFGFMLGSAISKVSGARPGKLWGAGPLDFRTRQQAAAARQTVMHTINETVQGTAERITRVNASYEAPIARVTGLADGHTGAAQKIADRLGISLDDATDDLLVHMYQEGDKLTRQRITKLRKALVKGQEAGREKRILEMERSMAETAGSADGWRTNTLAALLSGRKGLSPLGNMLPRVQATMRGATEAGFDFLPKQVNDRIAAAHQSLRDGARLLTRSGGMDDAPGQVLGANVEDLFLREITQLYKNDEMLRTAAIHALKGYRTPVAWHTPVVRNLKYNVGAWFYNKAGELPGVVTNQRARGWGPLVTAEDELESALQRLGREATVTQKGTLDMSRVDVPDEVKALFEWRQREYARVGKALRDQSIPYLQRELDRELPAIEARMDVLRETMEAHPPGSQAYMEAWNEWLDAERAYNRISEQAEAYRAAEDLLYQPVTLMPHKVRGDQAGFTEAAYQHFLNNPHVKLRRTGRVAGRGQDPTQIIEEATTEIGLRGRALALWHATVERVDYAGRPVGKQEFVRKLDAILDDLAPNRREVWKSYYEELAAFAEGKLEKRPRFPTPQTIQEAAWDSLDRRVQSLKKTGDLSKDSGGRYLQSEMFGTARLDPTTFQRFIEDRPTVQFRAYLEREVRRVHAAQRLGDADGMNPMVQAQRQLDEIKLMRDQDEFLIEKLAPEGTWTRAGIADLLEKAPSDVHGTKGGVFAALEELLNSQSRLASDFADELGILKGRIEADRALDATTVRLKNEATEAIEAYYRRIGSTPDGKKLGDMEGVKGLPARFKRQAIKARNEQAQAPGASKARAKEEADALRELNDTIFRLAAKEEYAGGLAFELSSQIGRALDGSGLLDVAKIRQLLDSYPTRAAGEPENVFDELLKMLKRWDTDVAGASDDVIFQRVNALLTDAKDKRITLHQATEALVDAGPDNTLNRIRGMEPFEVPQKALDEIAGKIEAYDMLRRQMMGEVLFEGRSAFFDKMNSAMSVATNISTAADLGMAGYSVSIDLGQMLAYYGLNPIKLGKLLKQVMTDKALRNAMMDPHLRFELGVSGEVMRGARLRAVQGADLSFGNQGGFVASGHYWADMGRWVGNFYAEAASNIMTASLLNPITDLTQMLAAPLAVTKTFQAIGRAVNGVGTKADLNILRRMGIDDELARRIWVQFDAGEKGIHKAPGVTDDLAQSGVVILPEFSTWRDQELAQHVMAIIGGDIRVATLHPGIATNRIWSGMGGALHVVSRMYYLFTRWAMVSSQNIYGKNIEDGTYQNIGTAMAYSTLIQATINWIKEPDFVESPILERLQNALVMSGSFGYMGIMNERLERLSGHQLGMRPMMGLDTFAHDPDSMRFRLAAFGPVTGKAGAAEETLRKENYGQFMRLFMPYQNFWLWSSAVRDASDFLDFEED